MRLHVLVFYSADDCSVLKLLIKNSYKTHSHYTLVCSLGPEGTGEGSQLISSLVLVVFHYSVPSKQRKKVKNSYKIWKTKKKKKFNDIAGSENRIEWWFDGLVENKIEL